MLIGIAITNIVCLIIWNYQVERIGNFSGGCVLAQGVDLSQSGEYTAIFRNSYDYLGNTHIYLQLPKSVKNRTELRSILDGFEAKYVLKNGDGSTLCSESLTFDRWQTTPSNVFGCNLCRMGVMGPLPGDMNYTLEVSVLSGAPALRGVPQRLLVKGLTIRAKGHRVMSNALLLILSGGSLVIALLIISCWSIKAIANSLAKEKAQAAMP
jgi:hypothetical protein